MDTYRILFVNIHLNEDFGYDSEEKVSTIMQEASPPVRKRKGKVYSQRTLLLLLAFANISLKIISSAILCMFTQIINFHQGYSLVSAFVTAAQDYPKVCCPINWGHLNQKALNQ